MTSLEKAKLLHNRHLKVIIEWGGTEHFTSCSDMSIDGVSELLRILSLKDKDIINKKITLLVQKEADREGENSGY